MSLKLKPELLQHPNIPKMLHGLAPRVIKGQAWWDQTRQEAYSSTNYHCLACGVHKTDAKYHQWLEAHEDYTINYKAGTMEVKEIIPLCHSCHNFIHSGRLYVTNQKTNPDKIFDILRHGLKILEDNDLPGFEGTIEMATKLKIEHNCKSIDDGIKSNDDLAKWSDWRLILDGQEYYSKFKDFDEWQEYYS
tara:strand:- start:5275 stop:5847 length:573 start_codon:yes stop_codon:yes gene_type:complete